MKTPPANSNSNSTKCCSAILRRFLCSGSLPTHPSESDDHNFNPPQFTTPVAANVKSPGVVARLMGLDSFPNAPLGAKDTSLAALLRTRSVNSIDFLLHFDPVTKGQLQHRRVRTSLSFREGLNDDCISAVLQLEKLEKECKPRGKKADIFQEKRPVGKKPGKRVDMEERKRSYFDQHVTPQKKDFQGTRLVIKPVLKSKECVTVKKRKNKVLAHKVHPAERNLNLKKKGSVPGVRLRKPLLSENGTSQGSCPVRPQDSVTAIIGRKIEKKMKGGSEERCYSTRMVEEICRVTEEDVEENWECRMVLGFQDFEEICHMFGQEILHVLLKQLVQELVLFHGTRKINLSCI